VLRPIFETLLTLIRFERPDGIPKGPNGAKKAAAAAAKANQNVLDAEYDPDETTANGPGTASAFGDTNALVIAAIEDAKDTAAGRAKKVRASVTAVAPAPARKTPVAVRKAPFTVSKNQAVSRGQKIQVKSTQAAAKPSATHRMATRSRNKPAPKAAPVRIDESDDDDDDDDDEDEDEDEDDETDEDIDMLDAAAGASEDPVAPVANMTGSHTKSRPSMGSDADGNTFVLDTEDGPVRLTYPELIDHFQTAVRDMTSQGFDCGVLPSDIIQALTDEINRLYGSMPNGNMHLQQPAFYPQQRAFYPQQPVYGPQMYHQAYQAPLLNQTYQPVQGSMTANSIRSTEQRYPVEARAMPASAGETPQHDFEAGTFNFGRPDTVVEAIRRLEAVEQTQLESPRSPSY